MQYTATIKNSETGEIEHTPTYSRVSIQSCKSWASMQGVAGHSILWDLDGHSSVLINDWTGKRALLEIQEAE